MSEIEYAAHGAAFSLVLAEFYLQRPFAIAVNPDSDIPYQIESRKHNWATYLQDYYYQIGFQIIPSLADDLFKDAAQVLEESWSELFKESLVKHEVIDRTSNEWQEVYSIVNSIISFLQENQFHCQAIATLLSTTKRLNGKQIDAVLDNFGLVQHP